MKELPRYAHAIQFASRRLVAMLAAVVLVWTGCDSTEEEAGDDTDRFVGTWDAVALNAGPLDVMGDMELVATFRSNGSVQIVVSDDNGELANVSGQYEVDTPAGEVTLSGDEFDEDLEMDYDFETDDELELSSSASDLENLGIDLGDLGPIAGGVRITASLEKRPGT